jgi:hypothetical protein
MSIQNKIQKTQKYLNDNLDKANYLMLPRSQSELMLPAFRIHFYFLRFVFSILSFALYLPTIIELYNQQHNIITIIKTIVSVCLLLLVEIGMSWNLFLFFMRTRSANKPTIILKLITFSLVLISTVLSGLLGANMIKITDNSQTAIVEQTDNSKQKDLKSLYEAQVNNNNIISSNNQLIAENNKIINKLSNIAATNNGRKQINNYQQRSKELQEQNNQLIIANSGINKEIILSRGQNTNTMQKRLLNASKSTIIFMVIFFLAGLIINICLIYSYNIISLFYYHLHNDNKNKQKKTCMPNPDWQVIREKSNIIDELKIPSNKIYIYNEIRDYYGTPINTSSYPINIFVKEIINKYPEGFKRTEILSILNQVLNFEKANSNG